MNAQQEAVALYRFLESRGLHPSVRSVGRILRDEMGVKVDDKALRRFLQAFTAVAPQSTATAPQKSSTITAVAPQATATPPRLRAHDKVSLVSELFTSPSVTKATNGSTKDGEEPWVHDLRAAANAIATLRLSALSIANRVVLGRYFAWRFAGFTRSEAGCKRRGAAAAVAFAKMGESRIFGDLTVREFVDEAVVYREQVLGGAPMHDPFGIRAVLGKEA